MLRKQFTTGLIAVIAIISTTVLVGARFDAIWAGGEGYNAHQTATVDGVEYRRGETIRSGEIWMHVMFGDVDILMDKNTEVKLIDGRPDNIKIQIVQGRAVVRGDLTIEVRELDVKITGDTAFVHYSWLDEIEIVNLFGSTRLIRDDRSELIEGALKTTTLPPYEDESISFDPQTSVASDFYNWAFGVR